MSENVVIAVIAAIPPTIAAFAAWRTTRRLRKPLDEVNNAVNHRAPGERRLVETVNGIAAEIGQLRVEVQSVRLDVQAHLAHHQRETQDDA